jgi:hypothetical protein
MTSIVRKIVWSAIVLAAFLRTGLAINAEEPIRLREQFPSGYQYHVSSRVELSGTLILPPEKDRPSAKPLAVTGQSAQEYDERVLTLAGDGQVQKTARIYRRIDFQRKVGDQQQEGTIRPAVRRLVVLRHKNQEVPFSPDGPLLWAEIDLVRTDVFAPALTGLLPDQPVRTGDRWLATSLAVQELTDMERIEEGQVGCRLDQVTSLDGRRHARVTFSGTVRGTNEDGPNKQQLDGYFYFDLESSHVSYVSLEGINFLLDKDGKEVGRVKGQFVLTRQVNRRAPDLSEEALRQVALEPTADNTSLLFDDPNLGLRFLYPRRWRLAGVRGGQLGLDAADGSGLLLTLESLGRVPTGSQFLTESRDYMVQQKAKILRVEPPRRLQAAPREVEQFAFDAEVGKQRVLLDYYVVRQSKGGATLAARLLPSDLTGLRQEVERIARSITITKEIVAAKRN